MSYNQQQSFLRSVPYAATEYRFWPITEKCVIYRGPDTETDGIRYRNVEAYLTAPGR